MINSIPTARRTRKPRAKPSTPIVASGPHGALAVAGIATAIVVALWFAFYLLVFLPRGARAMTTAAGNDPDDHGADAAVAARRAALGDAVDRDRRAAGRAWPPSPASIRRPCRRHASKPPIPARLHLSGRIHRKQSRQRGRARRFGDGARDRPAIFVHAAMHRGPDRYAGHVPRHQRRRGARLADRAAPTSTPCWCRAISPSMPTRFDTPGDHVMPCQEFCGIGHQGMWGRVKVIDKAAFLTHGRQRGGG